MDTTNRFAPPGAQVDDIAIAADGVQPVRLWPPKGRIGRLRLLAYGVGLYVFFIVVTFVAALGAGFMHKSPTTATVVGLLVYFVGAALLLIQRSHDMDLSGWWSIAAFIPLIGLFWLFKSGTAGANRWGAPPPPNGIGVKIIGLFFPVLALIGILAAVALPAYQQYNLRAKAAATP
jgi:uncharacterized membrane protein YhaH (DUF805 family)